MLLFSRGSSCSFSAVTIAFAISSCSSKISFELAVVAFCPYVTAAVAVDQLSRETYAATRFPHTPLFRPDDHDGLGRLKAFLDHSCIRTVRRKFIVKPHAVARVRKAPATFGG